MYIFKFYFAGSNEVRITKVLSKELNDERYWAEIEPGSLHASKRDHVWIPEKEGEVSTDSHMFWLEEPDIKKADAIIDDFYKRKWLEIKEEFEKREASIKFKMKEKRRFKEVSHE